MYVVMTKELGLSKSENVLNSFPSSSRVQRLKKNPILFWIRNRITRELFWFKNQAQLSTHLNLFAKNFPGLFTIAANGDDMIAEIVGSSFTARGRSE